MRIGKFCLVFGLWAGLAAQASSQAPSITSEQIAELKQQILKEVDGNAKLVQVMIDTMYSYGELGFQEFETSKYLTTLLEKNGFKVEHGISGIPTAWMATWGSGDGSRLYSAGIAEARCCISRSDYSWRSRSWRRAQLRPGRKHRRRVGREGCDDEKSSVRHHQNLARSRGRVAWKQSLLRSRRLFQGHRCGVVLACWRQPGSLVWRIFQQWSGLVSVQLPWRERTFRGRSVARTQRARCCGVDGRRLELPPRASSPSAALPLRHSQRRRPAECSAAKRLCLVLLPGDRLSTHQRAVGDRRPYGHWCCLDDRHEVGLHADRYSVARTLQQTYRGRGHREREAHWPSHLVRCRSNAGQGIAA